MSSDLDVAAQGAVGRALCVLEYLARAGEPTRLSAIATDLGLQKSTVHRILTSLASAGYVEQLQATGHYAATLKLWELGTNTLHQHAIRRASHAALQELHRATGETVSLTVLCGDDVLYLEKIIAPRRIKFSTRVGSRVPAPFTSSGKAMLAHVRDARARLDRLTNRLTYASCIDVDAMMRELAEVRSRGYASSDYARGLFSVAAPLLTRSRVPVGALTVSAPVERVTADARRAMIASVVQATADVSKRVVL